MTWCFQMYDVSPRKRYNVKNRLDVQIEATGHSIKDVMAVIMGHLRTCNPHYIKRLHFDNTN